MALWLCNECTTAYAVGAPACPACGSTEWHEQGSPEPAPKKAAPKKAAAAKATGED